MGVTHSPTLTDFIKDLEFEMIKKLITGIFNQGATKMSMSAVPNLGYAYRVYCLKKQNKINLNLFDPTLQVSQKNSVKVIDRFTRSIVMTLGKNS